jgi:tRNA(fMet)-specific endonuclease VapC
VKIDRMFSGYVSLPYDDRAASTYGRIVATLRRTGRAIGIADSMISAIALTNDLTVITRNVRHYRRVSGLNVVRW